jgi:hypothetical protein
MIAAALENVSSTSERLDLRVAAERQALAAIRSGTTTLEYYKLGALP